MTQPTTAPGRGIVWRPRTKDEHLVPCGGTTKRTQVDPVCSAVGLTREFRQMPVDCSQPRAVGSAYCYYHDKVQRGLIDSFRSTNSAGEWSAVPPHLLYPVYPLPLSGYVLLEEQENSLE